MLSVGVQESTRFNNLFTLLNLGVVGLVIGLGLSKADLANWSLDVAAEEEKERGAGGFFPFGLSGTLSGAATCFYGFVGFDAIATTGEETRNPQRSIPIAIGMVVLLVHSTKFVFQTPKKLLPIELWFQFFRNMLLLFCDIR